MRNYALALLAALVVMSCQQAPKQYFDSSPEIDMVKKGNQAYLAGDWAALLSMYADTAMVAENQWTPDKFIKPDAFAEGLKTGLADYSAYSMSDDAVYNMIISDKGEKWVLCWFNWTGTRKDGKTVSTPVHLAFRINSGGKVAFQVVLYNQLPGYLAAQPDPAQVMK